MSRPWILGSRGSALAMWQAHRIRDQILEADPKKKVSIVEVRTEGDRDQTSQWSSSDAPGVFVRELEAQLLEGLIDFAVHSLKDLPTTLPEGLEISCFPERQDPRDVLVSPAGWSFEQLPEGCLVATGSPRRAAQLKAVRPDITVRAIRGNVDTRLKKLEAGKCDALILAAAGLSRLELKQIPSVAFDPEVLLPAVGQGALAVQTRVGDEERNVLFTTLDNPAVRLCVETERSCLRRLDAGCLAPAAAYACSVDERIQLTARVVRLDGSEVLEAKGGALPEETGPLADSVAEDLLSAGAAAILQEARLRADQQPPL